MQRFQRNLLLQRSAAMAVGQLSTELKTKERNLENKALQLLMQAQRGGIEELQELAQRGLQDRNLSARKRCHKVSFNAARQPPRPLVRAILLPH